jgi:pyruvate ferredoxin oxidoreductase alpha subunit
MMNKRVGIEVSVAVAEAVGLADTEVVAAYPITPQTHIVEHLAEMVNNGRLDAEYIPVESEHSALSACLGSAAVGARTFTATASQGLALMHEILFAASSLRLPLVMAVANRAVSAPINIWADHSDVMPQRDIGWIQLFAENGQDMFDMVLQAFRLAEDHRVLLPVMVNMDGFTISHVIEPISLLTKEEASKLIPPIVPYRTLDIDHPRTIGPFGAQDVYTEVKQQQETALLAAEGVLEEIWKDFSDLFGRRYRAVESYRTEDAEIILVTMGAIGETARTAVDEMRANDISVGLARIRLWRPFPCTQLLEALENAKIVAVVDRMLSPGVPGGPVAAEIRSLFYDRNKRPKIFNFIAGLGGREINRRTFKEIINRSRSMKSQTRNFTLIDVRLS